MASTKIKIIQVSQYVVVVHSSVIVCRDDVHLILGKKRGSLCSKFDERLVVLGYWLRLKLEIKYIFQEYLSVLFYDGTLRYFLLLIYMFLRCQSNVIAWRMFLLSASTGSFVCISKTDPHANT